MWMPEAGRATAFVQLIHLSGNSRQPERTQIEVSACQYQGIGTCQFPGTD